MDLPYCNLSVRYNLLIFGEVGSGAPSCTIGRQFSNVTMSHHTLNILLQHHFKVITLSGAIYDTSSLNSHPCTSTMVNDCNLLNSILYRYLHCTFPIHSLFSTLTTTNSGATAVLSPSTVVLNYCTWYIGMAVVIQH